LQLFVNEKLLYNSIIAIICSIVLIFSNLITVLQVNGITSKMTHKPLVLSVETSGRTGSVAIAKGDKILEIQQFSAPMKHSAELFPRLKQMLQDNNYTPMQIEQVYLSIGPGSFTGLRIATTLAKMMHLANNNVKIVAVDTLDIIAANADLYIQTCPDLDINNIAVILDAKRGRFFAAAYQKTLTGWEKIIDDCLISAKQFIQKLDKQQPVWILGEGLVYYSDDFKTDNITIMDEKFWYPSAEKLHSLGYNKACQGQFDNAETLAPAYLCGPQAEKKRSK